MRKYNLEERKKYLRLFKDSGVSAAHFCRERGINVKTFGNWLHQARQSEIQDSKTSPKILSMDIIGEDKQELSSLVRIDFPSGVKIELSNIAISDLSVLINSTIKCFR